MRFSALQLAAATAALSLNVFLFGVFVRDTKRFRMPPPLIPAEIIGKAGGFDALGADAALLPVNCDEVGLTRSSGAAITDAKYGLCRATTTAYPAPRHS